MRGEPADEDASDAAARDEHGQGSTALIGVGGQYLDLGEQGANVVADFADHSALFFVLRLDFRQTVAFFRRHGLAFPARASFNPLPTQERVGTAAHTADFEAATVEDRRRLGVYLPA